MNVDELKRKYKNNPEFATLVNTLTHFMYDSRVTPQDVRDACFIAGLRLHEMMEKTGELNKQLAGDVFA